MYEDILRRSRKNEEVSFRHPENNKPRENARLDD
jgi:hypothetical protein